MYERILVPLDGSNLAARVLPYVEELAQKFGSEVLLFQTITPLSQLIIQSTPGTMEGAASVAETGVQLAEEELVAEREAADAYLASVQARLAGLGVKSTVRVQEGSAGTAIITYADQAHATLVAMSTHGRGGLERLVFGSVTDEVLRHSKLPLLLIRSAR